jgi:uncharacterized protein (DUF2267 family)
MEELVKQVSARAGIGEEQARQAIDTVVGFLRERLPEAIAGHVDTVLNNQQAGDVLGNVADRIGGMFGGE